MILNIGINVIDGCGWFFDINILDSNQIHVEIDGLEHNLIGFVDGIVNDTDNKVHSNWLIDRLIVQEHS